MGTIFDLTFVHTHTQLLHYLYPVSCTHYLFFFFSLHLPFFHILVLYSIIYRVFGRQGNFLAYIFGKAFKHRRGHLLGSIRGRRREGWEARRQKIAVIDTTFLFWFLLPSFLLFYYLCPI